MGRFWWMLLGGMLVQSHVWAAEPVNASLLGPHRSCEFFTVQELENSFDLVVTAVHPQEGVDLCNLDVSGDELGNMSITIYDNIVPEVWASYTHPPEKDIPGVGRAAYWDQFGPSIWTAGGQQVDVTIYGTLTGDVRARLLELIKQAVARLDAAVQNPSAPKFRESSLAHAAEGVVHRVAERARLVVQVGHLDTIKALAVSPDGKTFATGADDHAIKIWDVATGRELRTLTGHQGWINGIAYSPDGSQLASVSQESHDGLKLWEVVTGKLLRTFAVPEYTICQDVAFSGVHIAAGCSKNIAVWDLSASNEPRILEGHQELIEAVRFSADGKQLVSGAWDKTVRLWDVSSGKEIGKFSGHEGRVYSVDIANDGQTIASGGRDQAIRMWDVRSGQALHVMKQKGFVQTVAFSPDGRSLLSSSNGDPLTLWDVATGEPLRTASNLIGDGASSVRTDTSLRGGGRVAFSPDGRAVVATTGVEMAIWDISRPPPMTHLGSDKTETVVFSPDGRTLASGGRDGLIRLWDVEGRRELMSLTGHTRDVSVLKFSADGKILASGSWDQTVRVWDVASGKALLTLTGHATHIESLGFLGDNLFSSDSTGDMKIWNLSDGKLSAEESGNYKFQMVFRDGRVAMTRIIKAENQPRLELKIISKGSKQSYLLGPPLSPSFFPQQVLFSPDGRLLACVFEATEKQVATHTVWIWDVASGREIHKLTFPNDAFNRESSPADQIRSIAFSVDGSKLIASGLFTSSVKIWDTLTWQNLLTLPHMPANSVALAPDGKTLASGNEGIWFVHTGGGADMHGIESFGSAVNMAGFSPDGHMLAFGTGQQTRLWDLTTGMQMGQFTGTGMERAASIEHAGKLMFSSDGQKLLVADWMNGVALWDMAAGREVSSAALDGGYLASASVSADFGKMAGLIRKDNSNVLRIWDVQSGLKSRDFAAPDIFGGVQFSADGRVIAVAGNASIKLLDAASGAQVSEMKVMQAKSLAFSPDGKLLAAGKADDSIKLLEVGSGKKLFTLGVGNKLEAAANTLKPGGIPRYFPGHEQSVEVLAFSPDGKLLASGSEDNTVRIWDVGSRSEKYVLTGHASGITALDFSKDGSLLVSTSRDGTARLWNPRTGRHLATLISFNDGAWVVTDPEGRFDTADLEQTRGLHWVMPDDPLTPVPLEAFMRDYYEPRLLPRILNGEKFKPVRELLTLNRVQPEVKMIGISPDASDPERAVVEIEVSGARRDYQRDGKKVAVATAANDLRLFRDGQLVGHADGALVKAGDKPGHKTFNVHLPSALSGKDITFSAYTFNDDRVKSATAHLSYQVPSSVKVRKGNAYLIHIGVNRSDNPAWNLRFAANDAQLMRQSLSDRLQKTGDYQQVLPVSLISDETEHHADKASLHAVLDRLAGKPASSLLKDLPGAEQLQPATPDDLVLITFSGHGYAEGGEFYLLTQDTGTAQGKQVTPDLLKRSISSEELSQWLRDVDAGDMTLIVDACQSAASVQGNDFKPGPMGSRGLGQLSFDKGMRILAASQADEYALENDQLKQGLLSFSLVTDGLDAFNADREPKDSKIMLDEWLRYGVDRVPTLAEEVKTGKVHIANRGAGDRGAVRVNVSGTGKTRPAQQPALFDFAKKRRQVEVAEHR